MRYLKTAVLVALCWLVVECAMTMRELRSLPARAERQVEAARMDLAAQIALAQARAERQIDALRTDLRGEIEVTRAGLLARVDAAGARIDARAAEIQQEVAAATSRATETASTATSLLEDARPGVQAWARLSPALAANTLGLVAATKVTAGEAAQAMREIQRATPDLVSSINASAMASEQAAQAAAQTAQNLAHITRPGPRWLRSLGIAATVAVPASQVALPFVVAGK